MRRRSVATRLALGYSLVSIAVLLAFFALADHALERVVRKDAGEILELYEVHASALPGETPVERVERLRNEVRISDRNFGLVLRIFDRSGALLLDESASGALAVPAQPESERSYELVLAKGARYWCATGELGGGERVQTCLSAREFLNRAQRIRQSLLALLPLALLAFSLLGVAMARWAAAPVARIVAGTRSIGVRNLDARIPRSGRGDELDEIVDAFNALLGRLEQSFAQLRDFSGEASHQLRTPLTALRARIELALDEPELPARSAELLARLLGDADRLGEINAAMLRLARLSAGLDPAQRSEVDLAKLAQSVVEFFEPLASARGIALACELRATPTVIGDADWLRQLLVNLTENAIAYTSIGAGIERDAPKGRVTLSVDRDRDRALVRVSDTGRGIPEQQLERIFDRFHRVQPSDAIPGVGLGLAIAREIASVHDGSLSVTSREGEGSCFTLELPLARSDLFGGDEPSEPQRR